MRAERDHLMSEMRLERSREGEMRAERDQLKIAIELERAKRKDAEEAAAKEARSRKGWQVSHCKMKTWWCAVGGRLTARP